MPEGSIFNVLERKKRSTKNSMSGKSREVKTFSEGLREFITNRHDLQEMLKAGTKGHWNSNLKPYKMIIIMPVKVAA